MNKIKIEIEVLNVEEGKEEEILKKMMSSLTKDPIQLGHVKIYKEEKTYTLSHHWPHEEHKSDEIYVKFRE